MIPKVQSIDYTLQDMRPAPDQAGCWNNDDADGRSWRHDQLAWLWLLAFFNLLDLCPMGVLDLDGKKFERTKRAKLHSDYPRRQVGAGLGQHVKLWYDPRSESTFT